MSKESWMDEFYPEIVSGVERTNLEALKHSLRKWEGLTTENMERHDVSIRKLEDGERGLYINSSSCALCYKHRFATVPRCVACPIYKSNGVGCRDGVVEDTFVWSEWGIWSDDRNPQPMIDLLRKLVVEYSEDNKEEDNDGQ